MNPQGILGEFHWNPRESLGNLLGNRGASNWEAFLKCIYLNRASRSHAKTGLFVAFFWCLFCVLFSGCILDAPGSHNLLILVPKGAQSELFWSHFDDFFVTYWTCENGALA